MPCLKKGQIQDNSHWVVLLILAHDDDDEQNSLPFPHIIKALVRCVTHFHSHVSFHFHGHQSNTSVTLEKNEERQHAKSDLMLLYERKDDKSTSL